MGRTINLLSKRIGVDGKSEITVRLSINEHDRPCFKSGIYVNPQYFKPISVKKGNRNVMGIVPPKQGKLNFNEVREAMNAKEALDAFSARLLKLCQVAEGYDKSILSKEWIEDALALTRDMKLEDISIKSIAEEKKKIEKEEDAKKKNEEQRSIYELADMYLKQKRFSYDHTKAFKVLMRDWMRYELFVQRTKDKKFKLDAYSMTKSDIIDFEDYLRNEYYLAQNNPQLFEELLAVCPKEISPKHKSPKLAVRGNNTIVKLKKKFKAFFCWLNDSGITNNKPFEGVEIGTEKYGEPIYINKEERDIIANHDFSNDKHLETQRDIFIFQCLVGCRIGDYKTFTNGLIIDGILEYIPHKTKNNPNPKTARIPLTPKAIELAEKYIGKDSKGRIFPFISPQKYNESLKEIFIKCGITRNVQWRNAKTDEYETRPISELAASHMARKTFIGNMYQEVQDPNIISKMSGHVEGSKAFARYRKIEDETLKKAVDTIEISEVCNNSRGKNITSMFASLSKEEQLKVLSEMMSISIKGG